MDISNDITLMRLQFSKQLKPPSDIKTNTGEDIQSYNRKLKKACDGFEEIFVHKMLEVMRSSGKGEDLLAGGRGEEIFQDMLDENYSKLITQSRSFGLSDYIYEHNRK